MDADCGDDCGDFGAVVGRSKSVMLQIKIDGTYSRVMLLSVYLPLSATNYTAS